MKVSAVSGNDHHSIHAYFNTSPESPDGGWILFYASRTADGHDGEIRIRQRLTGKETVLARGIACEDAHRAACQQWVAGGRHVVFHNVLKNGTWVVMGIDIATGKERLLAKGRQLGFGQPTGDVVPLYGPHWNPGEHRGIELLNVVTGKIEPTKLTPAVLQEAYPDWVKKTVDAKPFSLFFPLLSPDLSRVIFKIATPAGGDFRSKLASVRTGLFIYDLKQSKFLYQNDKWGHPAWHPNSRNFINAGGILTDIDSGKVTRIPKYRIYSGDHPSYSPDGKLYTTDTTAQREPFNGGKGFWAVVVGDVRTGESVVIRQFDNSQGARSWRVSHPHPSFSPDGKRLYFNVSDGEWTQLHVAEVGQ
jgi:Tol biopolymer transport system component